MDKINRFMFATFATAVLLIIIAAVGWALSFAMLNGNQLNPEQTDFEVFLMRLFLGVIFIGLINGLYKLGDFFKAAYMGYTDYKGKDVND